MNTARHPRRSNTLVPLLTLALAGAAASAQVADCCTEVAWEDSYKFYRPALAPPGDLRRVSLGHLLLPDRKRLRLRFAVRVDERAVVQPRSRVQRRWGERQGCDELYRLTELRAGNRGRVRGASVLRPIPRCEFMAHAPPLARGGLRLVLVVLCLLQHLHAQRVSDRPLLHPGRQHLPGLPPPARGRQLRLVRRRGRGRPDRRAQRGLRRAGRDSHRTGPVLLHQRLGAPGHPVQSGGLRSIRSTSGSAARSCRPCRAPSCPAGSLSANW